MLRDFVLARPTLRRILMCALSIAMAVQTPSALSATEIEEAEERIGSLQLRLDSQEDKIRRSMSWQIASLIGFSAGATALAVSYVRYLEFPSRDRSIMLAGAVAAGGVSLIPLWISSVRVNDAVAQRRELVAQLAGQQQALAHTQSVMAAREAGAPLLIRSYRFDSARSSVGFRMSVSMENFDSRTIKYAYLDVVPYNQVYDVVRDAGSRTALQVITIVGPLETGETTQHSSDIAWMSPQIEYARIERMRVIFMDGTEWETTDVASITDPIVESTEYRRHATQMGPRFDETTSTAIHSLPEVLAHDSAEWERPAPGPTEVIVLSNDGFVDDESISLFARSADSVIAVIGDAGFGSGFFITSDGYAVTNHHVIAGQSVLRVRLRDGRETNVRVLRSNPETDIALLEVQTPVSVPLRVDKDLVAEPGSAVLVIGTPLSQALSYTVTRGIVSGLRFTGAATVFQTDAAVNPGNSGGPLIHEDSGAVQGIVSTKIVGAGVEGLAFATDMLDGLRSIGVRMMPGRAQ